MATKGVTCFRDVELSPLVGQLDLRTEDGGLGLHDFRLVFNMSLNEQKSRCRRGGWKALFKNSIYGFHNQDFHDQLNRCDNYYETFQADILQPGGLTGYQYLYWTPGVTTPEQIAHLNYGPYCGYPLNLYSQFPQSPGIGEFFLCEAFVGYPYFTFPSASSSTLNYPLDDTVSHGIAGTIIQWDQVPYQGALDYLNDLEAVNGPSTQIDDARDFIYNVYFPATSNTTDPQGTFTGTHGTIDYLYYLDYDGIYYTGISFSAASGPLFYSMCNSGAPDFFPTSYYSLCYNALTPEFTIPAYGSYPVGVYQPPTQFSYEYCGSHLYHRPNCNEAITMLGTITTENQGRRLIVGTKSKIAALNEQTGNWKLIFDGLGGPYDSFDNCNTCSSRRFSMATMGSYAFFTNDFDPVIYWQFDAKSSGCKFWAGDYVQDLLALSITKARTICSWNGFLILGNIEESGSRKPYRIIISDFNSPLSFIPGAESLTRQIDLPLDETIIRIEKLGGGLRVYTNKGIREGILVGGEEVISFQEIYAGSQGLKYAYSLVNTGDAHYYLGESTIQILREFDRSPNEVEWVHKAAGAIYKGVASTWVSGVNTVAAFGPINKEHCDQAVGFFRSTSREVWFSWPTDSSECPNRSLVINIKYGGADIVDHGFTAGIEFLPDPKQSIAEWLVTQKICGWDTILSEMVKEGMPYSTAFSLAGGPTSIWNATENLSLPADQDSLCALLGSKTLEDFCRDCAVRQVFVMASAADKTLKEYDPDIYYRERYLTVGESLPCPYTITGVYTLDGYTSLLQSDLHDYGKRQEKLIDKILVDYDALEQTTPSSLNVGVAFAANANCPVWKTTTPVQMRCLTAYSAAQHLAANTRPNLFGLFKTYWRGRYLGWRLFVEGTGGGSCFSGVTKHLRLIMGEWK